MEGRRLLTFLIFGLPFSTAVFAQVAEPPVVPARASSGELRFRAAGSEYAVPRGYLAGDGPIGSDGHSLSIAVLLPELLPRTAANSGRFAYVDDKGVPRLGENVLRGTVEIAPGLTLTPPEDVLRVRLTSKGLPPGATYSAHSLEGGVTMYRNAHPNFEELYTFNRPAPGAAAIAR
jgi:hypothetical protein